MTDDQMDMFAPKLSQTAPFVRGSQTSKEAAAAIKPKMATLQQRVLDTIKSAGSAGLTDEQVRTLTGLQHSTETPRRIELVAKGLVKDSGRTRKTRSGRSATVWVAA